MLNIISLLAALQHWYVVLKKFGSVANVLIYGNLVYSYRTEEGIPGAVPYLDALALTGAVLGGVYTARRGRATIVGVLPLVIVLLIETANMGRAKLVMAAILFVSGFVLGKVPRLKSAGAGKSGLRRALSVLVAFLILVGGAEFVRSTRGPTESFSGASRTLQGFRDASFITPSIYLYATVHVGVLNQYLKEQNEHVPFGANTLASVYRILAKLGFDTKVSRYQIFYCTPAPANTATYIRELHADFGLTGVLLFPYILGVLSSVWWYRIRRQFRYADLPMISFLFVVVGMSIFVGVTRAGELFVSLFVGWLIGLSIDRKLGTQALPETEVG